MTTNTVIITGRNLAKLEKAKSENPDLQIVQNDVTDVEQVKALVEKMKNEFGGIDVLVNNAGMFHAFDVKDETYPFEKQEFRD